MKDVKNCMTIKINIYIKYTLIFIILFSCCYLRWFWYNSKAMFENVDGLEQQFTYFVYAQNWVRTIFKNIFIKHKVIIPMWDMAIGYGADILASFGTIISDPFCWITAWIPVEYSENVFEFVIMVKFYLAGLIFIVFSRYRGNNDFSCLIGAIVYCFSSTIYVCFKQASFINAFILFPLILLGFFKIWNYEKPYIYMIGISISFMLTFYNTYMICIFLALYYCLLFITEYKSQNKIRDFFILAIKYLGYAIVSIFLALGVTYPVISNLSGTSRLMIEHNNSFKLLFEAWKIRQIILGCITVADFGTDDFVGMLPIVFSVSGLFFIVYKKKYALKLAYLLLCLSLFIPLVGSVFNGFNYTTFRWTFGLVMASAYIVTAVINNVENISSKAIIVETLLIGAITVITVGYGWINHEWTRESICLIWITFIVLCFYRYGKKDSIARILILFITMISAGASAYYYFAPSKGNFISRTNERGTAYHTLTSSGGKDILEAASKSKGYRYDTSHLWRSRNSSLIIKMSGLDFYNSYYNQNIDNYHNNLGLVTDPWNFGYSGLNSRSILESLNGVNYYIVDENTISKRPYGYDNLLCNRVIGEKNYLLYGPVRDNCIFTLMDNGISDQEYMNEGIELREQILGKACVLNEGNPLINTTLNELDLTDNSIYYNITPSDESISIDGNLIIVNNTDSYLDLSFDEVSNVGVEVLFKNIRVKTKGITGFSIFANAYRDDEIINGVDGSVYNLTSLSHMYGGKHDWLLNLGYSKEPINNIRIAFDQCGEYSIDEIKINLKSEQFLSDELKSINHSVNNINVKTNEMSLDVDIDDKKILFVAVPYSEGWSVTIDGSEGTIYKADDAFMAVHLPSGKHKVQFMYKTAELKKCIFFLVMGVLLSVLIIFKTERGKK